MSKTKAHQRYRSKVQFYKNGKGIILPGVTTVIGEQLGWNKRTLMGWARREALAGNDPDAISQQAADIGTVTHKMVECHIAGSKFDKGEWPPNDVEKAENGYLAFLEWEDTYKVRYEALEIEVISEAYMYGGTADIIATTADKRILIDLKTSKGVYPEMAIQVAAYREAYNEEREDGFIDECHILKLGKEDGGFEHHKLHPDKVSAGWEIFKHLLEIRKLQRKLK
jgi:hypothetical protein